MFLIRSEFGNLQYIFSLLGNYQNCFALSMALQPVGSVDQSSRAPLCEPPQSTFTLGPAWKGVYDEVDIPSWTYPTRTR